MIIQSEATIMNNQQLPKPLANLLVNHLLKIEFGLIMIILLGYILKLSSVEYGSLMFSIGMLLLSSLYFLAGFIPPVSSSLILIISKKVIFISYSIVTVGLLFILNSFPGAGTMINIGSLSLLVALLLFVIGSIKNFHPDDMVILIRALILLTLVVLVSL